MAMDAALGWLDAHQDDSGFWVGMLESNYCMEAEWLLAMHFLGVRDQTREDAIIRGMLEAQREDGAWEIYHDAPSGDINTTVECYAALRSTGMPADDPALAKARDWILSHGGLREVRVFTRYWLALIGEWPWEKTPNLPPEIIFFPLWVPFNIYHFASWARATLVPLCILSSRREVRPLPADRRLDALFPEGRERQDYALPRKGGGIWDRFFRLTDRILHAYQHLGITPWRSLAVRQCTEWVIRHQDADGAWGGIQPPWIYSLMALNAEGYPLSHPVLRKGLDALDAHWSYERGGALHIQASESIIWDTWLSLLAMHDCGRSLRDTSSMVRGFDWVLRQQVIAPGDWQVKVRGVAPGGWAFERANLAYPDVDDTAVALIVLALVRTDSDDRARIDESTRRALDWTLAMQCRNGGWAAFDRDNDKQILTRIPVSDFGEALDPPSADVTAHVLEALGLLGMNATHPAVSRGLTFIRNEQETDGSWFGRWGVNHIYGTAAVLPALRAIGEDMSQDYIRKAADWIAEHQNDDGGWGESCASYMDIAWRGRGKSTASQTGWALMALLALDNDDHREAIESGVDYLISTQLEGTWDEPEYTGTGFPGYGVGARTDLGETDLSERLHQGGELQRGFMINYNLYRHYFPLMALGRARTFLESHAPSEH
ncbi:MAG: squalene--hopene cyclase [Gammaproteobacteria bacterium]|nr:squalene--hopene cyclase [Gammaproteobacteria bacterium]